MGIAVALCAFAIALIENQPSYGAARSASSAHPLGVVPRVATRNGLTAQVDPATGLVNQVVKVSWSGFHPTDSIGNYDVLVYECKANPTSLSDCYTIPPFPNSGGGNSITNATTAHNGTGFAFFEVRNASKLPDLNCSSTVPCSLLVWENDGSVVPTDQLPVTAVVLPIQFARSSVDCPVPEHLDVRAEGEASGGSLFYNWIGQLCSGNPKLALDYTTDSSNNGRADALAGSTDMGVTSLGATKDELATSATKTKYEYAPLDLNAVVVAFNVWDPVANQQITDITLTPRLLARLVTDSTLLQFFQDPEFLKLNPGHHWPTLGASQPAVRAEINADTRLITSWMIQDPDAKSFIAGHDKYGIGVTPDFLNKAYPVDNFEKAASDDGFDPLTGEQLAALHLFYGVKPADSAVTRPTAQGFFGIIDRSTAEQFDLPMAKLVNHAGNAVGPDDAAIAEGYKSMTTLDGVKVPNFTSTDTAQYPLTKIDYGMVRQTITTEDNNGNVVGDPAKVKALKTFIDWEAAAGQTQLYNGYVPLPPDEVKQAQQVAKDLKAGSTTPQTTTTTVTVPTTFDTGSCCSSGSYNTPGPSTVTTLPTGTTPATRPHKTKVSNEKVKLVAAEAPSWAPAGAGGSTAPSPLWFVLVFGLAALAARLVWFTSPKVIARVQARRAAPGEGS